MKVLHWVCVLVKRTNRYLCVQAARNISSLSRTYLTLGLGS